MRLRFLGQAGFLIKTEIIIDPYLSDGVAEKYGARLSRQILMMCARRN